MKKTAHFRKSSFEGDGRFPDVHAQLFHDEIFRFLHKRMNFFQLFSAENVHFIVNGPSILVNLSITICIENNQCFVLFSNDSTIICTVYLRFLTIPPEFMAFHYFWCDFYGIFNDVLCHYFLLVQSFLLIEVSFQTLLQEIANSIWPRNI